MDLALGCNMNVVRMSQANRPNRAPEPAPGSVTSRADAWSNRSAREMHSSRQPPWWLIFDGK